MHIGSADGYRPLIIRLTVSASGHSATRSSNLHFIRPKNDSMGALSWELPLSETDEGFLKSVSDRGNSQDNDSMGALSWELPLSETDLRKPSSGNSL